MEFTLSIALDNTAFDDPHELARILRAIANDLESSPWRRPGDATNLRDINGNTVGRWEFTE